MREHLSAPELELYGARRLSTAERWAFEAHLAECPACRERAAGVTHAEERFESLLNDFERTASAPLEHLDFGQIAGFVDEAMNEAERAVVADHLAVCASCVREVSELSAFRVSLETVAVPGEPSEEASRSTPFTQAGERPGMFGRLFGFSGWASPLTAGAAALVLLSVAGLFWFTRSDDAPTPRPEVAQGERPSAPVTGDESAREGKRDGEAATGERAGQLTRGNAATGGEVVSDDSSKRQEGERDGVSRPSRRRESPATPGSNSPAARRATEPTIVAALNDGGRRIVLDDAGNLAGLERLSESDRRAVRSALASGRVPTPPALVGLAAGGGPLLGGGSVEGDGGGAVFAPVTPVGTFVRAARPSFKWRALEGATSYVVNVFDTSFNKVATSGALKGVEWTPPAGALAHGRVYVWQVTAVREGEAFTAPAPDAAEARFKVLGDREARELDAAQRVAGDSRLALGVIYARAGLLDEAEREFRLLLEENPASATAQKLLRDLRARGRSRPRR